jgi:hypothetical protein
MVESVASQSPSAPFHGLQQAGLLREVEDPPGVGVHDRVHQIEGVRQTEPAFVHQLAQGQDDSPPRDRRVSEHGLYRDVVTAKREDLVGRGSDQDLLEEVLAATGLMIQDQHMSRYALV